MGFLGRRRAAKLMEDLKVAGDMGDRLVGLPLTDETGQELRLGVERRLEGDDWSMPDFWWQIAVDYTNTREDIKDEEDNWAFTDAVIFGYVLRIGESERVGANPVPVDIAVRLANAPADGRQHIAMQTVVDVAARRLPEFLTLTGEAWSEFESWARQFNVARSRGRTRVRFEAAGVDYPAFPSLVDYEAALAFGYALRCCEEVSDFLDEEPVRLVAGPLVSGLTATVRDNAAAASAAAAFDPLDLRDGDAQAAAEDLLHRTEAIFVTIRAPSRIGVAINKLALLGSGVEEGHPQYSALLGTTLFGYTVRMAQAHRAPLPAALVGDVETQLSRGQDGSIDYDQMAASPEALTELLQIAGTLADHELAVLTLLRIRIDAWTYFVPLATEQLRRNLRRNGLARRFLPSDERTESLIRLGCAIRVIDEVAGELPFPATAL